MNLNHVLRHGSPMVVHPKTDFAGVPFLANLLLDRQAGGSEPSPEPPFDKLRSQARYRARHAAVPAIRYRRPALSGPEMAGRIGHGCTGARAPQRRSLDLPATGDNHAFAAMPVLTLIVALHCAAFHTMIMRR